MTELEKEVKKNLIKYCYDEIDEDVYQMYLDDVHMGDYDLLWIRVTKEPECYPEVFITHNEDDNDTCFISLNKVDASAMIKILNQMFEKKQEKTKPIDKIVDLFKQGYDVPAHFAVPSIKDYILDKVKGSETCYIGQVGLSGDEDGTYLSVFFPCKEEPGFSYDTPLEKLTKEELGCVLRNMKKS